jgi:NAD(P)H dehydrogenase (quinone)
MVVACATNIPEILAGNPAGGGPPGKPNDPMRILVIYCHPDDTSFAGALHKTAIETLAVAGHAVTDLDLYREGFKPVLSLQERTEYSNTSLYVKSVEKYADQLAAAEALVAIYPTWWYGMPAMLKGYFDRVWAPGIAYDVTPADKVETKRLAHIRRIAVVTTYGAPWWMIRLYLGDPERKLWSRAIRRLCARDCELAWHAHYDMDHATQSELDRFLTRFKTKLARW